MTSRRLWRRVAALSLAVVVSALAAVALPRLADARPAEPGPAPLAPAQEVPAGHIVVRGRIYKTARAGDRNHPASGLRVEIWDKDDRFGSIGELLTTTVTDAGGRYESTPIENVDKDGPTGDREGTQDVYLRVATDNGTIVLNDSTDLQPYDWTSFEIDQRDGAPMRNVADGVVAYPTLYIAEATKDAEAMWTFVNLAEAADYLRRTTGSDPGRVTAFWSRSSDDGPRYDPASRALHFRDEDAAYPDRIVQYATYAILHNIYGDLPAEWQACLEAPADPRRPAADRACALWHGLATFLPLAVSSDPLYETPDVPALDLDAGGRGALWSDGDGVPARIAGAFWDLHEGDRTVETYDRFDATFADVWSVFPARSPVTLAAWWEGWKALGKNGCGAVGSLYQNTIDYNTAPRVQPIPDVVIDEDETAIVDLKNYVDDDECSREDMVFTLVDAGAPEAGVHLLPTNVISITPQADWSGRTSVIVGVSDGLVVSDMAFNVTVVATNDCPVIKPRVPDPPPAQHLDPIELDLSGHATDAEDPPDRLAWDAEVDPRYAADVIVLGRGTQRLVFVLDAPTTSSYSALVTLVVRDTDGCAARQSLALFWIGAGNHPPRVAAERFTASYWAPVNSTIRVDLTGVGEDDEDPPDRLEWFVLNGADLDAQVRKVERQIIDFEPQVGFVGSNVVQLELQDTGAARATAAITLTWTRRDDVGNQAPQILRSRLVGQTVGRNSEACYELTDKATDPDHNQLSLRWYADPDDPRDLFVGAQGTRRLCLRARDRFEGCLFATFVVRDPLDAEDRHPVRTCWEDVSLYLPRVWRGR